MSLFHAIKRIAADSRKFNNTAVTSVLVDYEFKRHRQQASLNHFIDETPSEHLRVIVCS